MDPDGRSCYPFSWFDPSLHSNDEGTPQGGSISVLLSNLYLHYVLDVWFDQVVKPRLEGEAYLVRYIDDFVVCFQYRADALRMQNALRKRLDEAIQSLVDAGLHHRPERFEGALTGLAVGTCKAHLHRARQLLRAALSDEVAEGTA